MRMGGIPVLSVDSSLTALTEMYSNVINKGIELKSMPSVMLWGAPGIGKSQSVRELGNNLTKETGKKVAITDVRLILFNPIDLRGIPTANEDKTLAVWLRPQIFDMDPSKDVINILFLDEISAASPSVQAAAYQITLDRKVGEHMLPDNCIVIAAGNRVTDKSVAYQMPKALANRLLHMEITADYDSWNRWAVSSGINPMVLGFMKQFPDKLNCFNPSDQSLAFATPRSWELVSNILNNVSDDMKVVYNLVSGLIGTGLATEFKGWIRVFGSLPDIEAIFNGTETKVPTKPDVIYALTSAMVYYASKHQNDTDRIANSIRYADKLSPDYTLVLLKDYMYIGDDFKLKLLRIPEYQKWLSTKGKMLDAANRY